MTRPAQPQADRRPWWLHGARIAGLLFVIGFIVQLNSERAYWFYSPRWFTTELSETLGTAAFYGFAAAIYVVGWSGAITPTALEELRFVHVFLQMVAGAGLVAWALVRTWRQGTLASSQPRANGVLRGQGRGKSFE